MQYLAKSIGGKRLVVHAPSHSEARAELPTHLAGGRMTAWQVDRVVVAARSPRYQGDREGPGSLTHRLGLPAANLATRLAIADYRDAQVAIDARLDGEGVGDAQ